MADEFLCPKCHQPVDKAATFCGNCGFQLIAQAPTATAPASAATAPTTTAGSSPISGTAPIATPATTPPAPATTPTAAPPPPTAAPTPGASLAVPAKDTAIASIHDIKGVKAAAWTGIILGAINTILPILGITSPDTVRQLPGYEKYSNSDFVAIAVVALLLITPLIISGIVLLRTHDAKRGRHWLIAMLVPSILFCLATVAEGNLVGFALMLTLIILAIRAYSNIKKYEKSAAPVTPAQ